MEAASFVFDVNRCTGCGACRVACTIENRLAGTASWRRIETFNPTREPDAPLFHLSTACNHCATAACMHACPALAYRRDPETRAVLLEPARCIGCGYCAWACPYDAPVFDEAAGVMTKCTWCVDRLSVGLKPACVTHCPTGALDHAPVPPAARSLLLFNPAPEARIEERGARSVSLDDIGLEPSLHVVALKPGRMQPEMDAMLTTGSDPEPGLQPAASLSGSGEISLRREWPLAVFTLGAAILVGIFAGAVAGTLRVAWWAFAAVAAAIMGVAGAHLGRPGRGWRAVLNVRRSWLSREIVAMSLFTGLATVWLLADAAETTIGWAIAAIGFAALYAADRLYGVLPSGPGYQHSAGVLLTGALFASLLSRGFGLALAILVVKLQLYWGRRAAGRVPGWLPPLRGVAGFVVPAAAWTVDALGHPAVLVSILLGEALDRAEYYTRLERRTPRREMDRAARPAA